MQSKMVGFFLVLAGILLLILRFDLASLTSFVTWPFLLFLFGALLIFTAFLKKNAQTALLGGIIAGLGISIWGLKYVDGWPNHWSILLVFMGMAFLLQFSINKNGTTAMIGGVLVLSGIFAWPGIKNVPFITPIASILHIVWPVFIILLGVIFIFRK